MTQVSVRKTQNSLMRTLKFRQEDSGFAYTDSRSIPKDPRLCQKDSKSRQKDSASNPKIPGCKQQDSGFTPKDPELTQKNLGFTQKDSGFSRKTPSLVGMTQDSDITDSVAYRQMIVGTLLTATRTPCALSRRLLEYRGTSPIRKRTPP